MKRGPVIGFILGAAIGSGATYLVMRAEVQKAVAAATEKVGKTVKDMGQQVEKAGREMKQEKGARK